MLHLAHFEMHSCVAGAQALFNNQNVMPVGRTSGALSYIVQLTTDARRIVHAERSGNASVLAQRLRERLQWLAAEPLRPAAIVIKIAPVDVLLLRLREVCRTPLQNSSGETLALQALQAITTIILS